VRKTVDQYRKPLFSGGTHDDVCKQCRENPPAVDIDRLNYIRGAIAPHLKRKSYA